MIKSQQKEMIQNEINNFKTITGYKQPLEISSPYLPYVEHKKAEGKARGNDAIEPCEYSDQPGVYIFCAGEREILYVGKCSGGLGNRVWAHLGKAGDVENPFPNAAKWIKSNQPNIVFFTVGLKEGHWFMAPALEEFLIFKLKPTVNATGKRN
jgi:hypothetical protein